MARYIDAEPLIEALETDKLKIEESIYAKGFDGALATILGILRAFPTADVVEIPKGNIGNLSDGYHTFNELYHHRAILFSVICNSMPDKAWKSKLHDTGDMYEGMFIVGIETPEGQATYHYDIEPYWDLFKVKELEKAPKYDGHTPQEAIDRISKLSANVAPITDTVKKMREKLKDTMLNENDFICISASELDQIAKEILEGGDTE